MYSVFTFSLKKNGEEILQLLCALNLLRKQCFVYSIDLRPVEDLRTERMFPNEVYSKY